MIIETPSFVKPMEDKETVSGETTVLECMASGSPKPRLVWTKDGGSLVATERHFFTADNQLLIIVDTKALDAGRYECEMSNPLGTERDSSMLTVIAVSQPGSDDDSATIGIIIIAVVCCVVGTSIVWVIIIYHTRKRARNTPPSGASSPLTATHSASAAHAYPGVEFIAAETDDGDLDIEAAAAAAAGTILYPPDLEILAFKGSAQQLYSYLTDNNSDSEQSSGKDSGTGDSARRSNSNEDVAILNDNIVHHQSMHSLHSRPPSQVSGTEAQVTSSGAVVISAIPAIRANPPRLAYPNYTRTLSTFVPQHRTTLSALDNRANDPRARMSLYEDRRPRSSRNSLGSPVANYSLARHEV